MGNLCARTNKSACRLFAAWLFVAYLPSLSLSRCSMLVHKIIKSNVALALDPKIKKYVEPKSLVSMRLCILKKSVCTAVGRSVRINPYYNKICHRTLTFLESQCTVNRVYFFFRFRSPYYIFLHTAGLLCGFCIRYLFIQYIYDIIYACICGDDALPNTPLYPLNLTVHVNRP